MIWACFSSKGLSPLAFVQGNQRAAGYRETLQSHLLPFLAAKHEDGAVFMQDGAPAHTAGATKAWLESRNIAVLPWVSRSPDLNPIENLWGVLARRVYANGRQFQTEQELTVAIEEVWAQVEHDLLLSLARSISSRIAEVIRMRGAQTKY